jgi:hypothetical protein
MAAEVRQQRWPAAAGPSDELCACLPAHTLLGGGRAFQSGVGPV